MREQTMETFEPLESLGGRPIEVGSLAATLEVLYLQKTLAALRDTHRFAIDVGAHRGDVTEALTLLGFSVLAVEPQPKMADRLSTRFEALIDLGLVQVERGAASNRRDKASLMIGKASTVTTLESSWTQIAFPEEFESPVSVEVPLRPLSEMMRAEGFETPAFIKIDVEGHELPVLEGLFATHDEKGKLPCPPVVMFEANQRFADAAMDCIRLLSDQGYTRFDLLIRDGVAPIAATRFVAPDPATRTLPPEWFSCGDKYFYANLIAYHYSLSDELLPTHPQDLLQCYQLGAARDVLRRGLEPEAKRATAVHPIWGEARVVLRNYLLQEDWREFLTHPVCRNMFYRGRWGVAQDHELAALNASELGRTLLQRIRDPKLGGPRFSEESPLLSTNMLGMLYYLLRVASDGDEQGPSTLPDSLIEIGGGYGAFAWLYACSHPTASYTIIDLPEMLAIQYYYLSLTLPGHRVRFASRVEDAIATSGEIVLLPSSLLDEECDEQGTLLGETLRCQQLFSTFGFSEFPRESQRRIERTDYFRARRILLAGQLSTELPDLRLVGHSEVVGAAIQRFEQVNIERFHIGDNYLLLGSRAA